MPPPSAFVIVDVDAVDAFTDIDARDDARRRAHRDRAVEETDSHRIARADVVATVVVAIAGARRALTTFRFGQSVGRSSSRHSTPRCERRRRTRARTPFPFPSPVDDADARVEARG
jgi:hypothetical protein